MKKKLKIKIKRVYKERAPHLPTKVHKNKKKYNRKRSKQKFVKIFKKYIGY